MSSPLVSIIIPAYKAEHFITRCLNSCIEQSYPHIEVIVINDCSPDSTGFICDQFALINTNIRVIHNLKNEGPQLARPKGVSLARGELITFLDSDDSLASNAVELLVNEAIKTNADIVIGGYEIVSNRGSQYRTPPKTYSTTRTIGLNFSLNSHSDINGQNYIKKNTFRTSLFLKISSTGKTLYSIYSY
ncbi:glycosyltransferase family 2 protein [Pseudomonas denitrificans (nom. rej.)]|uniref:Glycosyltransferase family 2 protein n=1 Tax=Pseudomonas denitrificans TaxID=43306 RepID=A0A9X7R371_PSEDE|nr:glycosyltransferase family 2 protein [Pseudomonas denitrificans (nom. rej.)]